MQAVEARLPRSSSSGTGAGLGTGAAAGAAAGVAAGAPLSIQLSSGKSLSMKSNDLESLGACLLGRWLCKLLAPGALACLMRGAAVQRSHAACAHRWASPFLPAALPPRRPAAGSAAPQRTHSQLSDISEVAPTPTALGVGTPAAAAGAPRLLHTRSAAEAGGGGGSPTITTLPRSLTAPATRPSASLYGSEAGGSEAGGSGLSIEPGGWAAGGTAGRAGWRPQAERA